MEKITKTLSLMMLGAMTFSLSSVYAMEEDGDMRPQLKDKSISMPIKENKFDNTQLTRDFTEKYNKKNPKMPTSKLQEDHLSSQALNNKLVKELRSGNKIHSMGSDSELEDPIGDELLVGSSDQDTLSNKNDVDHDQYSQSHFSMNSNVEKYDTFHKNSQRSVNGNKSNSVKSVEETKE